MNRQRFKGGPALEHRFRKRQRPLDVAAEKRVGGLIGRARRQKLRLAQVKVAGEFHFAEVHRALEDASGKPDISLHGQAGESDQGPVTFQSGADNMLPHFQQTALQVPLHGDLPHLQKLSPDPGQVQAGGKPGPGHVHSLFKRREGEMRSF